MLTSYHNHSLWSDGRGSLQSMLSAAQQWGLDELGISDHLVLDPHGATPSWSMQPYRLPAYLDALDKARREALPRLRIGIELDWISGQREAIAAALDDPRYDYAIGSVHRVMGLHVDSAPERLGQLGPEALEALYDRYWALVRDMAHSGLFDIAAHLDLPKKLLPNSTIGEARGLDEALDAIAAAGMVVELNTAGWDMPCQECYPSPRILAMCKAHCIPVTIAADAHSTQHLLRHFDRAVRLLGDLGYGSVARFEGRRILHQPLEDFAATLARP